MFPSPKNILRSALSRAANYVLDADAKNLRRAMRRKATAETLCFIEQEMSSVKSFSDAFALLDESLRFANQEHGLFCEFGVYSGSTINFIAARLKKVIYGFDSFEGLPEDWQPGVQKGTFRMDRLPRVRKNVRLIQGWFQDTLPAFVRDHDEPCSFLHIDCDLYSSTKTVFEAFGDRIDKGTVIVFDEYFNYPGWRAGEFLAFQELISARRFQFEYLGYADEQVAVRITG